MILKGSQRGGSRQLAAHLMNIADNDHILLHELRGFVSCGLPGAMAEADAVAKGTKCRQPIFSLSLNPPKEAVVSTDYFVEAADRAEATLGLQGQPRAIVVHEKEGRCHAHVVWSRIDVEQMKAINMSFYKDRLKALSKEFYFENGWPLPEGLKAEGRANPLNFTLAEWQQARRQGIDPREIKQAFQQAWARSDNLASFKNALEEQGYFLAKGDRRGMVAFDIEQNVYSVTRWAGVKAKDAKTKFGDIEKLPTLDEAKAQLRKNLRRHYLPQLAEMKKRHQEELKPLGEHRKSMVQAQRKARVDLVRRQALRHKAETLVRSGRFRKGLATVLDLLTGRLFSLRKQNAAEALVCAKRDKEEREALYSEQRDERWALQNEISGTRHMQREERLEANQLIADALRATAREPERGQHRSKDFGLELEL